jgi:Cu-Zn family superoxide dismutase
MVGRNDYVWVAACVIMLGVLAGCAHHPVQEAGEPTTVAAATKAVCVMHPTEGSQAHGIVTFTQETDGVRIVADLEGLAPGDHGFHIHEYGDCSAPDGTSAGGHFNPDNQPHGGPMDAERHVGDLGNVTAGEDGTAHLDMTDRRITFSGAHSIVGRGIILHAAADDLTSQPTGNAGARLACGVIGIAR